MNKKIIGIFIAVVLMGTALFPDVLASFEQKKNVINSTKDCSSIFFINETYLITNPKVPYVGQGNDSFCALASTAMQINYLGFNTTLPEILHDTGYGYLRIYCNFIFPSRLPLGGAGITQMDFSMEFLADIYNITFRDFSMIQDPEKNSLWDSYYEKIKDLISSDIPIQTGVDPYKLTFWKERMNFSNETTGGHAVVIVGYNDINNTICYNDPYAAAMNISGMYIWENQDIFRTAVEGMSGFYKIYVFYKQDYTEKPTRKERFNKVHEMNIQRLKGDFKYYFGIDIDPSDLPFIYRLFFNSCYHIGLDAAEKQKIDIHSPIQRLITLFLYKQYETLFISPYYGYDDVFQQIENVSTYLLEQQNLSPLCMHDGLLLKHESMLWKNLSIFIKEIQEINLNNSLFKTLILTNPIFDKIIKTIDEIIDIEQEILNDKIKIDNNNQVYLP